MFMEKAFRTLITVVASITKINNMINCLNCFSFGLKIKDNLTDYLSCKIQINQETTPKFVMQSHLINSLFEKLKE
jgi:hypothetical protein